MKTSMLGVGAVEPPITARGRARPEQKTRPLPPTALEEQIEAALEREAPTEELIHLQTELEEAKRTTARRASLAESKRAEVERIRQHVARAQARVALKKRQAALEAVRRRMDDHAPVVEMTFGGMSLRVRLGIGDGTKKLFAREAIRRIGMAAEQMFDLAIGHALKSSQVVVPDGAWIPVALDFAHQADRAGLIQVSGLAGPEGPVRGSSRPSPSAGGTAGEGGHQPPPRRG